MRNKIALYQMIICFLFGIGIGAGLTNNVKSSDDKKVNNVSIESYSETDAPIAGVSKVLYDIPLQVEPDIDKETLDKVGSAYIDEEPTVESSNEASDHMEEESTNITYEDVSIEKDVLIYETPEYETVTIAEEVDELITINEENEKKKQEKYYTEEVEITPEGFMKVKATAYHDKNTADGTKPYYGVLAGKREWLGKKCRLYNSKMELMGEFEFHDVGYGRPTGEGVTSFKSHAGKSIGSIEAGKTIDIYMDSESEVNDWGRRTVYIEWIDE